MCHEALAGSFFQVVKHNGGLSGEDVEREWEPRKPFPSALETHSRFELADPAVDDRVGGDIIWLVPPTEVNATGTDAMDERVKLQERYC